MWELIENAVKNQVFGGIVGGSLVVSLLYALRQVPITIWNYLIWRFTCSLTIFSEDAAFERMNEWLSGLDYVKKCRQLRLSTMYDGAAREDMEVLAPGIGKHMFWYRGKPIIVTRKIPDKGGIGGWKRYEDITIETFGGSSAALQSLVTEIKEARRKSRGDHIDVYLYRHRWRLVCRKPKRDAASVILPGKKLYEVLDDVREFIGGKPWYTKRGVPYRRGYLFEGPPGCGKTSLAMAVASFFERPIYALNLGSIANDDDLIDAVCEVPDHGILLLEDVDAAKAGLARTSSAPKPEAVPGGLDVKEERREISLSGLLNVIDGVFSREGRILIMTTNHPDKVDPALLRKGRVDWRMHIGELGDKEVEEMCLRFFDDKLAARRFSKSVQTPIAAASLQELLVQETRTSWEWKPEAAE